MDIGVRQLRDSLGEQLALVRQGHSITITSHGRPIARIVPTDRPTAFEELETAGLIRPARRSKRPARDPIDVAGSVSDLLDEQRR